MSAAEKVAAPVPRVVWLSPDGECSDTEREGWERVEIDDPMPGPREESVGGVRVYREDRAHDRETLEVYAEQMARLEADEVAIRARYDLLRSRLDAQEAAAVRPIRQLRSYLEWAYLPIVKVIVGQLKGKRKFVDVVWGRFGWKKAADRVEVVDEGAAIEWASEHAPDAVPPVEPRLLKGQLPKAAVEAGQVPGVRYVKGEDQFYAKCAPKARGEE